MIARDLGRAALVDLLEGTRRAWREHGCSAHFALGCFFAATGDMVERDDGSCVLTPFGQAFVTHLAGSRLQRFGYPGTDETDHAHVLFAAQRSFRKDHGRDPSDAETIARVDNLAWKELEERLEAAAQNGSAVSS